MTWIDITSYSRDDDERTPTMWSLAVPADSRVCVVVTCNHIYYRPKWAMHVQPFDRDAVECQKQTREGAMDEAIQRAHAFANKVIADLNTATYRTKADEVAEQVKKKERRR